MTIRWATFLWVIAMAFTLAACGEIGKHQQTEDASLQEKEAENVSSNMSAGVIHVSLKNSEGKKVGQARLVQTPKGVEITVEASHLTPGEHGFHIHETGECVVPDFESAGGHFNPFRKEHGLRNPKGPHAGDLPNLLVEENGSVDTTMLGKHVTLEKGKKNSLLDSDGSALVIHADPDDQVSQPSGNSGARVVCGVIHS